MAETLAPKLDAKALKQQVREQLKRGVYGKSLTQESLIAQAYEHAKARGSALASERDLLCVVLSMAGYELLDEPASGSPAAPPRGSSATTPPSLTAFEPRLKRAIPTLERFSRDLT